MTAVAQSIRHLEHHVWREMGNFATVIGHLTNHQSSTLAHNCENCKFRARYDRAPKSLLGRFWRWHINFCPGWRGYFNSLSEEEKAALRLKYNFTKY